MSPRELLALTGRIGFPRVSGDEPAHMGDFAAKVGFSPRERG